MAIETDGIEFEKYGILQDFDDGHIPEGSLAATKLYKSKRCNYGGRSDDNDNDNDDCDHASPSVQIYKEALPPSLCQQIYDCTVERDIPWGTYVTKEEAMSMDTNTMSSSSFPREGKLLENAKKDDPDAIQRLATSAVRCFLFQTHDRQDQCHQFAPNQKQSNGRVQQIAGRRLHPNLDTNIHGVQIWALPARKGSSVPYHIDYAEYIRYTRNVIVTPMYAGTVQCTPHAVKGGTFAVHLGGLSHYQKHGYKCALEKENILEGHHGSSPSPGLMAGWDGNDVERIQTKDGWVSVPYAFGQGILHSGDLPHLSGTILDVDNGGKRVIVGFNVFDHDIGPVVAKCPEHSDHFRKMVKLHRSLWKNSGTRSSSRFKLDKIRENKALTKMLVLAKRQKIKGQWEEIRSMMTSWLIMQILDEGKNNTDNNQGGGIIISKLLQRWRDNPGVVSLDTIEPTAEDLHVHIHTLLKRGRVKANDKCVSFTAVNEIGQSIDSFVETSLVSTDFKLCTNTTIIDN